MRDDLACLAVVVDRSGSMLSLKHSTITSFNSFIEEQKSVPGEAVVTLVLFNHEVSVVEVMRPIAEIAKLTDGDYLPSGNTALYDAIGETITQVGRILAVNPEDKRPGKVIVTIITDGLENSSKEYSHDKVAEMIKHQQDVYGWQFLFLGANIDTPRIAAAMNIPVTNAMSYQTTEEGLGEVYAVASAANSRMRTSK